MRAVGPRTASFCRGGGWGGRSCSRVFLPAGGGWVGPVCGFLSTAQPGRGGAAVAGLAVGMSVRLQLVGKQMGGYRVHPMHAECIAGNGRFCTRRWALGAADRAEGCPRRAGQRQLQAAIGALWQGGGWVGPVRGFLSTAQPGGAAQPWPGLLLACRFVCNLLLANKWGDIEYIPCMPSA